MDCGHVIGYHTVLMLKKPQNTETSIWIDGMSIVRKNKDLTFSLGVFLSLLLILSGDIELNPGPKTGNLLKNIAYVVIYIYVYIYLYIFVHTYYSLFAFTFPLEICSGCK